MKVWWIVVLLPLGSGIVIATMILIGWLGNPMLYLRADLLALVLLAGLLLSGLGTLYLWRMTRVERNRRRELSEVREGTMRERQRFLQRLDHELKNPLMAVRAGLANLLSASSSSSERQELTIMQEQLSRVRQLTADLRKLAQLETLPLNLAPVDVAELLRQAVELAEEQPAAQERRLTLILPQAPWPLPTISGDRELLLAAVSNLLDNALKFTRPGDTVEVRASEDERVVQIEVADTGPGIPPEDLPHLGKDLYRGRSALGVPGSGVGLALTQAIVERHDGQLTIRSRVDRGTVVTMRLPVVGSDRS